MSARLLAWRPLCIALSAVTATILLFCGGGSYAFWLISHDEVLRDNSPDRQVDAVVQEVNPGAMDDYVGWVFLVPHGGRVWPWSEPELIMEGSPGDGRWKDRTFSIVGRKSLDGSDRKSKAFGRKRYEVLRIDYPSKAEP